MKNKKSPSAKAGPQFLGLPADTSKFDFGDDITAGLTIIPSTTASSTITSGTITISPLSAGGNITSGSVTATYVPYGFYPPVVRVANVTVLGREYELENPSHTLSLLLANIEITGIDYFTAAKNSGLDLEEVFGSNAGILSDLEAAARGRLRSRKINKALKPDGRP